MNVYWITIIFIVWYALSLVISETIGKRRKIGVEWSFFISMIFSPIIGYIVAKTSPKALNAVK
ncbi:MAG: hypothetical protein CL661_02565 [Bacteroidetes bacterium]|jgi:hypothetical protein|nr:hypothetical protein [Bacteroidota bacterium]|tara:strand:- start:151 stop:339 length:189 start_codon:yes stop_codon:yes gene_type:complete